MALSSAATAFSSYPQHSFPKFPSSSHFFSICASSISPTIIIIAAFDLHSCWTNIIADINSNLNLAIPLRYPPSGAKHAPLVMCIVVACDLLGLGEEDEGGKIAKRGREETKR
ncbi:hypothetical protein ACLOJK_006848 [Asimina triloba]